MTRAEIEQRVRWLLNELGTAWLLDTDSSYYDIDQAIAQAYDEYARAIRCFRVRYTLTATADLGFYSYDAFGREAANTASISVAAEANNTTAFTLVSGQPASTYMDKHYVTVTINNTGVAEDGVQATYTVTGTQPGGIPYSEGLLFTAPAAGTDLDILATMPVTKTTTKPFSTVTGITVSAAQPDALWLHSAGVGVQTAGSRIVEPIYFEFDERPLVRRTHDQLDAYNSRWRTADSGTPICWVPWPNRIIRLYPAPSSALNIYGEFYETPDSTLQDADTETPEIEPIDHELLAIRAALLILPRNVTQDTLLRSQEFKAMWEEGKRAAYIRYHGTGGEEIVFGRHADVVYAPDQIETSTTIALP